MGFCGTRHILPPVAISYRDSDEFGQRDKADEVSSVFNHHSLIHMGLDCKSPCSPHTWSTDRLLQLGKLLIAQPIIGCGN